MSDNKQVERAREWLKARGCYRKDHFEFDHLLPHELFAAYAEEVQRTSPEVERVKELLEAVRNVRSLMAEFFSDGPGDGAGLGKADKRLRKALEAFEP